MSSFTIIIITVCTQPTLPSNHRTGNIVIVQSCGSSGCRHPIVQVSSGYYRPIIFHEWSAWSNHVPGVVVVDQSDPRIDVIGSAGVQLHITVLVWLLYSGIDWLSARRLDRRTHTHTKTDIETQWQTQTQTDRHRRTDSVYHRTGLASVLWHKLVSHHTAKQTDRQRDRHKQRDRQTDTALGPYRIADFYYSE